MKAQDTYRAVTDHITRIIETSGRLPWVKPWTVETGAPRNVVTGKAYRGMNVWTLGACGHESPWWLTRKQAWEKGGWVIAGEQGVPVVFYKAYSVVNSEGEKEGRFVLQYSEAFHISQCKKIKTPVLPQTVWEHTPIERCAKLVGNYPAGPSIGHGGDRAYYVPGSDHVQMPEMCHFKDVEAYYSTLFHELTHSTGHASRLNRSTLRDAVAFGTPKYAQEELVAEMGAAYLCGVTGIGNTTINQSAAYLQGWLRTLKSEPRMLLKAASDAQKAVDYIQGL